MISLLILLAELLSAYRDAQTLSALNKLIQVPTFIQNTIKNYLIAGLQLGLEFEYFLSENIGIVLTGQEQWSPLSAIRKWHTQGTIGVRLIY